MMQRMTQLMIERKLADRLMALPQSSRSVIDAWYKSAIENVDANEVARENELRITKESVEYAIEKFRQGN